MLSLDLAEAREVSECAARGDAEALALLSSLFSGRQSDNRR